MSLMDRSINMKPNAKLNGVQVDASHISRSRRIKKKLFYLSLVHYPKMDPIIIIISTIIHTIFFLLPFELSL